MNKPSPVKMGFLLLGSFILAYLTAETLHELCHAVAAVLTGGQSSGIVVDPFNWSYSSSYSFQHPVIHIAAGALGSSLIAFFLFILVIGRPKPVLLPLLLIGPITLINNGYYWVGDVIEGSGMDACRLTDGGISAWLILFAGIVQCLIGIMLAIYLIRVIGLTNERFKNRLIVFSIGIAPYALAGVFWNWYSEIDILWFSAFGFAAFFVIITGFFKTNKSIQYNIRWSVAAGYTVIGAVLVIVLSAMASPKKSTDSSSLFKTFTNRPGDFPEILIPHNSAIEPVYTLPPLIHSVKHYVLHYSLPEDVKPQEIRDDLTALFEQYGYVQLHYNIDEPDKPLNDNWQEEITQAGFKRICTRQYTQRWIKLTPEVSYLFLSVHYIWRGNKFQTAGVMMGVWHSSDIDEVLLYIDMHPEGFNLFEVDQLKLEVLFEPEYPESCVRIN